MRRSAGRGGASRAGGKHPASRRRGTAARPPPAGFRAAFFRGGGSGRPEPSAAPGGNRGSGVRAHRAARGCDGGASDGPVRVRRGGRGGLGGSCDRGKPAPGGLEPVRERGGDRFACGGDGDDAGAVRPAAGRESVVCRKQAAAAPAHGEGKADDPRKRAHGAAQPRAPAVPDGGGTASGARGDGGAPHERGGGRGIRGIAPVRRVPRGGTETRGRPAPDAGTNARAGHAAVLRIDRPRGGRHAEDGRDGGSDEEGDRRRGL